MLNYQRVDESLLSTWFEKCVDDVEIWSKNFRKMSHDFDGILSTPRIL